MPRAGASGLFPTASSVPCGAGDYSMPPAQSPLWRAHSQGPMVGACPGGSFSFLPGLLPHHASAEMQRGEQPRPQGPVAAAAGGFLQSSLRSGSRGAVSSSMPDLLTGVDADRSRSMRGARSTWDFDDMDAVSSEDEVRARPLEPSSITVWALSQLALRLLSELSLLPPHRFRGRQTAQTTRRTMSRTTRWWTRRVGSFQSTLP